MTAICLYAVLALVEGLNCPPPVHTMPLSLTNYWTMDEEGRYIPWNGQADDSPHLAANGKLLTADSNWLSAACISEWTTIGWTTEIRFTYGGQERATACNDEFGRVTYRKPFYHEGYGLWVIPVDVYTPEPIHTLIWEWGTGRIKIEDEIH